ncbi:MAG: cytochrome c biogenesis protein CcdA [Planctomycetota bacterium]
MAVYQIRRLGYVRTLLLLILAIAFPSLAAAQPQPVQVSASATPALVAPGGRTVLAVTIEMDEGWHIYPHHEQPDASLQLAAILTKISLAKDAPATLGTIAWPAPKVKTLTFGKVSGKLPFYEGKVTVLVPITLNPDTPSGKLSLKITTSYQPCDETTCLQEVDDETSVELTIDPAAAAFDPSSVPGLPANAFNAAAPTIATPTADTTGRLDIGLGLSISTTGVMGLLGVLAIGLVGGFILNLTPCVLPIIPIKIIGLQQAAQHSGGGRGRTLVLGLFTALGIVLFWLVIGLLIVVFKTIPGVATLFTNAYFQLGVAIFVTVMGLGLLGAFTISLPQSLYAVNPRHDTLHGSILFGLMTAVLGTPCFGPFAGAVLGWATQQPNNLIPLATFVSIGVGMALPYVVLAAWPRLVSFIPRTGPASELVKQVMGLLLLAAAAFFFGVAFLILQADHPGLQGNMHWCIVAGVCVLTGLWMVVRTFQITPSLPRRVVFTIVALVISASGVWWAYRQTNHNDYWTTWTPEIEAKAKSDGKVVVTDYTAIWCVNCKFVEVLFEEPDVAEALTRPNSAALRIDLTAKDAPGWKRLESIHEVGIPVVTFEGPGTGYEPARMIKLRFGATANDIKAAFAAAQGSGSSTATRGTAPWTAWSPQLESMAKEDGRVVATVYSATWDINCMALQQHVDESPELASALASPNTTALSIDLTSEDAPGWKRLESIDETGVPILTIEGPGTGYDPARMIKLRFGASANDIKAALAAARGKP